MSTLFERAIVCDLTLPWADFFENRDTAIDRFIKTGVTYVSLTMGGDTINEYWRIMKWVARERRRISMDDRFVFVETTEDIRSAKRDGKLALGFHFQGTKDFGDDLNMISAYYDLGVRWALIAYNERNTAGDGCHVKNADGLTPFGRAMVAEMNRVGMVADAAHCAEATALSIFETSTKPCLISHANPKALWEHDRNVSDKVIKACAATGGVMGITGIPFFLGDNVGDTETFSAHFAYVADLVGAEHVGIGLDFTYFERTMAMLMEADRLRYATGYPPPPWPFVTPEQLPEMAENLMKRGFSDAEIEGILGQNALRVFDANWK